MQRGQPDLVDDLKYLRKSQGLTPERLANASAVIEAVGGRALPLDTLFERFRSAVFSMRDIPQAPALWAAYNLDGTGAVDLRERRAAYAASVGRKSDAVRDWEDRAIDILALRLLTRFYAGSPTPADFPVPHGGYLIRDLTVVCTIKDRRFVESRQTRTLIALVGGAETFDYGTYSPTELHDVEGGELAFSRHTPHGTVHRIKLAKPLDVGEPHEFSFRERVPDDAAASEEVENEDFSGQTFESPTLRYRAGVQFIGDVPQVVWGYDKLSRIVRPGQPEEGIPVSIGDSGKVSAEFFQCYGGLASGVAWRWSV